MAFAQETMESLGVSPASRLAPLFSSADLDGDASLSEAELASFETQAHATMLTHWVMASFEATLFDGPGCTGSNVTVSNTNQEQRCTECFDVCGKSFGSGDAMSASNRTMASGITSKVRSMRVTSGIVYIVMNFCLGAFNYGSLDAAGSYALGRRDDCVDFTEDKAVAHIAAVLPSVREVVAAQFLKQDAGPGFDDFLNASESPDFDALGLLTEADANQDGLLSVEEYATMLTRADALRRAESAVQISAEAMEDAAAASAMATTGAVLTDTEKVQLARSMFGAAYEAARADPIYVSPATPETENGQIVVGHKYAHADDYGEVQDESKVEGPYEVLKNHQDAAITLCTKGRYFEGGSCYEYCKAGYIGTLSQCWKEDCPKGWTEVAGAICKKNGANVNTKPKGSYSRGAGRSPKTCKLGDSFGPGAQPDNGNRDVTVVMASDVQLPWCHKEDERMNKECATEDNWYMIQGVKALQGLAWSEGEQEQVQTPLGVFIAGDLTAFGSTSQYHLYRKLWEAQDEESSNKNNKFPIWPGLGNHDYANNIEGCNTLLEEPTWVPYAQNACAQRMLTYIRAAVGKCGDETVVPSFGGYVDHYHKDSAAYTVRYGRIRFVHLHNYPTFRRSQLTGMASTIGFLKNEVALANQTGDYMVLVMHDVGQHFSAASHDGQVERYDYFSDITSYSRTLAVFAGHLHPTGGMKMGTLQDSRPRKHTGMINAWGEEIPVVRNWASSEQRFVVTQFNVARCYWRFGSVSAPGDKTTTAWFEPQSQEQQQVFQIPNCTVDENYTWTAPTKEPDTGSVSWAAGRTSAVALLLIPLLLML